jgi:hypothetical protein
LLGWSLAAVVLLAGCAAPGTSPSIDPSEAPSSTSAEPSVSSQPSPSTVPSAWRQLDIAAGPSARSDHTWTVDDRGTTAYLFGGHDGATVFDDLWSFDLAAGTWQRIDAAGGPPARFGHNASWVPGVGLVIFAGQQGSTFYNDLWAFTTDSGWSQLPASGAIPVPRYGSCAALGPEGRLWISHGFTEEGQRFADTRAYDFETATWTDESTVAEAPVARCLHACWWTDGGAFTLYAGQTTGVTALADLWRLTVGPRPGTNTWAEVTSGGLPSARNLYAAVRWGSGTLIVSGQGPDGSYLADTWWLADLDGDWTAVTPSGALPARAGAEMVADPAGSRILLFGGVGDGGALADLWELTLQLP